MIEDGTVTSEEARVRMKYGFWLRLAGGILKPILNVFTRHQWLGRENIPKTGPLIFAVNHISHADPLTVAHFVYNLPRPPRFLAKDSLFSTPGIKWVLRGARQIPVYRGTKDASTSLKAAREALGQGEAVIIYPEGTTTKDPQLWPMLPKTGIARLAMETKAPVIPVAQWGAQKLFDAQSRKLTLRLRTPVTLLAGPPVDLSAFDGKPLTSETLRAVADTVMDRVRAQLAEIRGETPPAEFYAQPRARRQEVL